MTKNEALWAIEPNWMRGYVNIIESATPDQIELAARRSGAQATEDILTINGETATILIEGFLSPTGPDPIDKFFGIQGTSFAAIRDAIETILADDNIKSVSLLMNTPGGTVTGTDETFQALSRLAEKKDVTAFNTGIIASGGYWLAIAADRIIATAPTAETGSIGVVLVGFDTTGMLEKFGVKKVVITSKNAPKKFADISEDSGIAILQERLDALESVFIARVAEGRGVTERVVLKDFGKGGMLIAQDTREDQPDAVSVGMIDQVLSPTGSKISEISNIELETKTNDSNGGSEIMEPKTLQEFLAQNAGGRAEYDSAIAKAETDGKAAGKAEVEARIKVAAPIMNSPDYPNAIKVLAAKVITGEKEVSALDAAVTIFDADKEAKAEATAIDEGDGKETNAANLDKGKDDGDLTSENELESAAAENAGRPVVPDEGGK